MSSSKDTQRKIYKKNESVVSRNIADEALLVPVRGELVDMQRIFSMNPVGEHIWEQLDGEQDLQGIRESVLDAFDVEKEQAEADISEFLGELLEADLILEVE